MSAFSPQHSIVLDIR